MQASNCFIMTNTHSINSIQSIKHLKIRWNLLIKYSLPTTHLIKHIICLCINDGVDGGKRRWNTSTERERGMLWGVRLSWSLTQTTPWGDMWNWIMKPRDEVAGWDWAQVSSVMMHRWRKSDTRTQKQRQNVQWALVDRREGAVDLIIVMTSTRPSANLLVDEVDGLRFELVGAVQVGQDEDLGGVFHGQAGTQRVLAHDLQSLQSILEKKQTGHSFSCGCCKMSFRCRWRSMFLLLKGIVVICQ